MSTELQYNIRIPSENSEEFTVSCAYKPATGIVINITEYNGDGRIANNLTLTEKEVDDLLLIRERFRRMVKESS